MTRWIDAMPAAERRDLIDAGRLGASRYEAPPLICGYCNREVDAVVSFVDGVQVCFACREREKERMR